MAHDDQPITLEKPTDLPGSPMSAVIGFDHPCCFCGYNLRSLALNGSCPECGATVNDALRGSRMQYQPLAWILRLKIGAQLAFWGNVALMLVLIGSTIVLIYSFSSYTMSMPDWLNWTIPAMYMLSVESMAVGMLMLSVSAPLRVRRKQLRARVTRTSSLCVTIAIPVYGLMAFYAWNTFPASTAVVMIATIVGAAIVIGLPLLYFFGLAQLAMISSLIPWKKGQKRTLVLQIYAPAAFVLWFIVYAIFTMFLMSQLMQSSQGAFTDLLFYATLPLATLILTLVGLIMSAGLFLGLVRQIKAVAVESIAANQAKHKAAVLKLLSDNDEDRFIDGED